MLQEAMQNSCTLHRLFQMEGRRNISIAHPFFIVWIADILKETYTVLNQKYKRTVWMSSLSTNKEKRSPELSLLKHPEPIWTVLVTTLRHKVTPLKFQNRAYFEIKRCDYFTWKTIKETNPILRLFCFKIWNLGRITG